MRFDFDAKLWLFHRMMLDLYWKDYMTRFTMENFKRDYPLAYNKLGTSLLATRASKNEKGWHFTVSSSRLPKQVIIAAGRFKRPDSMLTTTKGLESRLVRLYNAKHFLFRLVKRNPKHTATAFIRETFYDDDDNFYFLNRLKRVHKPIANLIVQEINVIELYMPKGEGRHDGDEKWFLLPDDSLICLPYEGLHFDLITRAYL